MSRSLLFVLLCLSVAYTEVVTLTDDNFDELVLGPKSGKWFVKIYAPWCGHCKQLAPTWEKLSEELKGEVKVGEIDATQEIGLATRFNIEGYPTLLFFYDHHFVQYGERRKLEVLKEFALEGYKEQQAVLVPRMPMSMDIMFDKLGLFLTDFLYAHPLVTASIMLIVGIIMGLMVTVIYFELTSPASPYTEMDEQPEVDKEKDELGVCLEYRETLIIP